MSNISVRLNYGSSHDNSSIFIQPLFYLGTNSVQKLFKKYKNPEYNEKLIDDNLQILSINNVIIDRWGGYENQTHLGEFPVRYEVLPEKLIDDILEIILNELPEYNLYN